MGGEEATGREWMGINKEWEKGKGKRRKGREGGKDGKRSRKGDGRGKGEKEGKKGEEGKGHPPPL